jgi:4-amino-4-deoxy-L-arabinose transferase-like glycosyltransferase
MSSLATLPAIAPRRGLHPPRHLAERRWSALVILAALCGFLFFYGLNVGELYRTEALRAIIAAEFLRSGNWIVPTLYGEPLFTKPPGHYAAIALCSGPFGGVSTWSARLPSAFAASATVFLFYGHFARQFGRRAGLTAAVVLPTSLMWLDKAPSAEIDMLQLAWVSAAILFFLRALEEHERPSLPSARRAIFRWWLLALLCVAGGFLTKWTAPTFFYFTVLPLLWWRGRLRLLLGGRHLASLAVAASLCLGWVAAAVSLTGWDVFLETVGRESLMRISPRHHHRPYPWGESLAQPFLVLATALPWSVFALFTLRPRFAAGWDERGRRTLQALHCWAWPNLLFWTVIPGHAVRYCLPLFPAIAGLAAMVLIRNGECSALLRTSRDRQGAVGPDPSLTVAAGSRRLPPFPLLVLAVWVVVKLVFIHAVVPMRTVHRQPRAKAEQLRALMPPDATLYLFHTKDEGIMFYYGRPVRRVRDVAEIPSSGEPMYCMLTAPEWRQWGATRPAEEVARMSDEQGAPMVLIRLKGARP